MDACDCSCYSSCDARTTEGDGDERYDSCYAFSEAHCFNDGLDRDLRGLRPLEPPPTPRPPPPLAAIGDEAGYASPTRNDSEDVKILDMRPEKGELSPQLQSEEDRSPQMPHSPQMHLQPRQISPSDGASASESSKKDSDSSEKRAERRVEVKKAFCVNINVTLLIFGGIAWLLIANANFDGPVCLSEEVARKRPSICEACGSGTFVIPIGGEFETSWHPGARAVLYILGIAWCFLGVCIVCDLFMVSIEQITSSIRVKWIETSGGCQEPVSAPFWNGSIANLSLVALGSSAPEIILNIIELLQPSRFCLAGELGISTIVGSAAFNLLAISSVCVSAIEYPDIRKIEQTDVFFVTATSSIFAYVWMWFVLRVTTPDKVDVWEAVLTLLFFPLLIIITYLADKQVLPFSPTRCVTGEKIEKLGRVPIHSRAARHAIINAFTRAGSGSSSFSIASSGSDLSLHHQSRIPTLGLTRRKIIVSETRNDVVLPVELTVALDHPVAIAYCTYDDSAISGERYEHVHGILRFEPGETIKEIRIKLLHEVKCQSNTEAFSVELTKPKEAGRRTTCRMSVRASMHGRVTRNTLTDRHNTHGQAGPAVNTEDVLNSNSGSYKYPRIGISRTQVLVLKDTEPGFLTFEPPKVVACPGAREITVTVSRTNGTAGAIACNYRTVDDGARAGEDFQSVEGVIEFGEGVNNANITIPILDKQTPRAHHARFYIVLEPAADDGVRMSQGRSSIQFSEMFDMKVVQKKTEEKTLSKGLSKTLGSSSDLGAYTPQQLADDLCSCAVVLLANATTLQQLCMDITRKEWWYWWYMYLICWREQVREAFFCGGTAEEQKYAMLADWAFHALSFVWKVMFAFIPPPVTPKLSCITFFACLAAIMGITIIIKDLAELVGCCIGLAVFGEPIPADITAITLVALGTSLPDTLASKIAAEEDESADSAIGNVTGSNSVNVFLGLGLPWTIASIYWAVNGKNDQWRTHSFRGRTLEESWGTEYPAGGFILPADSLVFNVSIFVGTAVACLGLLGFRRWRYGGELGGPKWAQRRDSFFLIVLWLGYIVGSTVMSASVA